jgi:hypothetical protein
MGISRTLSRIVGGVYSWTITIYFGAVLLDVVYSRLLNSSLGTGAQAAYNEVSDLLLLIGGFALLAGFLAIGLSWDVPAARNLFATSLLVVLVPELLTVMVLFPLSRTSPEAPILAYGPLIRLGPIGLGSVIGFLAFGSWSNVHTGHPPAA